MKHEGVWVIGLTGGIASGKSTVARFFAEHGVPVIDADQLARDVVQPGMPALIRISEIFGSVAFGPDGTLNRKVVRSIVFADEQKRKLLEETLHPEIKKLAEEKIISARMSGEKIIIYMAPLLIEAGAMDRVDEVWVVSLKPDVQLNRLMKRDNLTEEAAKQIIMTQMPLLEKERFANKIIDNNGTEKETYQLLEKLWKEEWDKTNE